MECNVTDVPEYKVCICTKGYGKSEDKSKEGCPSKSSSYVLIIILSSIAVAMIVIGAALIYMRKKLVALLCPGSNFGKKYMCTGDEEEKEDAKAEKGEKTTLDKKENEPLKANS